MRSGIDRRGGYPWRSDVLLEEWKKLLGTLWIKMLARCHTSRDIKCHGCCLHDQDMGWVIISRDMQILNDMGGCQLAVMSLDVRCNCLVTRCQSMCQDHSDVMHGSCPTGCPCTLHACGCGQGALEVECQQVQMLLNNLCVLAL